nr:DNA helicase [Tanacetum cinerariifolium]
MIDEEFAKNLEAQMQAELEEEQERLARIKEEETNITLIESWDNKQAMIDADCELAARLQEEREELSIEEKLRLFVELIDKRKKHFARLRAEKIRSKPPTKAPKRNQMCTYLKNMENYKHNQLKRKIFEEIKMLFNNTIKWIEAFVPMDTKLVKGNEKAAEDNEKVVEDSELDEDNDEDTSWIIIPQQYCLTLGEQGLSELIDFIYDDTTLKAPTA